MSKKTVKRHYKKHRISNKKKRTYRKNRRDNGTGKRVQLFAEPKKMHSQSISVTPFQSGNMIPGLRNM